MLTRFFNNLSIQALIGAMFFSYMAVGIAIYLEPGSAGELIILENSIIISSLTYNIISIILVPLLAYLINSLLHNYNLLKGHYFFIPLFSIQLTILAFTDHRTDLLLLCPLLMWFFHKLISLMRSPDLLENCFDLGIWIGIISIVVPEYIYLIPLLWLALLVFGLMNIRTLIIPFLGLFTIFTLIFTLFYFSGKPDFWNVLGAHFRTIDYSFSINWDDFWKYIPLAFLFMLAAFSYLPVASHAKIQKRQFMNFNFLMAVGVIFLGLLLKDTTAVYILLVLPFSLYQANMIQYLKKWWVKDLVFLTLLISLFVTVFYS